MPGGSENGGAAKAGRRKKLKKVKDFVLGDVLGEGAYGQVREGLRVKEPKFGQRVAVKIMSRKLLRKTKNGEANMKREVQCIKKLKHPNIIQLIDVIDIDDNDHVYLVFELANFKSIQDILDMIKCSDDSGTRSDETPNQGAGAVEDEILASGFTEAQIRNLFYQLVQGLHACHSKGVVHRDIKPSNLQLTLDGVLKIIDFGVAENLDKFSHVDDTEKFGGTPAFQPPEVASGSRTFKALKVDVWAAGVTLYVMATGKTPFPGDNIDDLYENISKGMFEIPQNIRVRKTLCDLIQRLMEPDPEKRADLEDVLEHPWFKEDDMSKRLSLRNVNQEHEKELEEKPMTLLDRFLDEDSSDEEDVSGHGQDDSTDSRQFAAEMLAGSDKKPKNSVWSNWMWSKARLLLPS